LELFYRFFSAESTLGCGWRLRKTLFQKAFSRIGFSDLGQHRTNIMQRHSVLGSV
jgi:hypothetical protein